MGKFKDLDDKIVDIDDPDYENKVQEQTFRDFQESDVKKKEETQREDANKEMHEKFFDSEDLFENYCPIRKIDQAYIKNNKDENA